MAIQKGQRILRVTDIVKQVEWKDVKKALRYFYPTDKNDYEQLFYKIQRFRSRDVDPDDHLIVNIGGTDKGVDPFNGNITNGFYSTYTTKYSCSFRNPRELANLRISDETLSHYRFEEIIAHFLWEVTFFGDEARTKREGNKLKKIGQKIRDEYDKQ